MRKFWVLYLESVTADSEFAECTPWRSKLPTLPRWPSRRKSNKKRPRIASGDGPEPKRRCSTRSKFAGIFTSGATAALIRESFPDQKGVVASETAPMPEDLLDISLEEVVFYVEWLPAEKEILPDNPSPAADKSAENIVEPVLELESEKEKPSTASGSRYLRSSASGRVKRKPTKKCMIRTQNMIKEGRYWSDKFAPESIEDGCLLLGLTQDIVDLGERF